MKRKLQLFLFFLCLGGFLFTAQAQKENLLIVKNRSNGTDSVLIGIRFQYANKHSLQHCVSIIDEDDNILQTFKAEDLITLREGKTLYASKSIVLNGIPQQLLLQRTFQYDQLSIYTYFSEQGKNSHYVQMPNDSVLQIIKDEPDYENPLRIYLNAFPIAQQPEVKEYINRMEPSPSSFAKRLQVCLTGNPNYITHSRWGILTGVGLGKVTYDPFNLKTKLQAYIGAFVDIPIYKGFSAHPEVFYREYASEGIYTNTGVTSVAAYNRREICLPILMRYTFLSTKGKLLPYVQAGSELQWAIMHEIETEHTTSNDEGFIEWVEPSTTPLKKINAALTASAGLEWKLQTKHSLFLDIRYTNSLQEPRLSGLYATISYNL